MPTQLDKEWFENIMATRGLSLTEVARRMSLDKSALSRALSGERKLTVTDVVKIASILDVSVTDVIEHAAPQELRGEQRDDAPGGPKPMSAGQPGRGFKEEQVDFKGASGAGRNTGKQEKEYVVPPAGGHPIFGCMEGTLTLLPDVDLTAPADPDWGKVYEG